MVFEFCREASEMSGQLGGIVFLRKNIVFLQIVCCHISNLLFPMTAYNSLVVLGISFFGKKLTLNIVSAAFLIKESALSL